MPNPHVLVQQAAGFSRILLDRPDQRNALDAEMVRALLGALTGDSAELVVLSSTDRRVFCAGADLGIPAADRAQVSDMLYECYEIMITRSGPVIAVLAGAAVGGGAQLAAAADLRVAGPRARLRWAGPPNPCLAIGAWVLPELVGRGKAMELTMTGRWLYAQEALDCGLVNWVDDDPDALADQIASTLLARGQSILGQVKLISNNNGLLARLRAERSANKAAWDQMLPGSLADRTPTG